MPAESKVLPGFEKMRRFWSHEHSMFVVKVLPGEHYVTQSEELISTALGSCISACIRDPMAKIGGINHFMLAAKGSVYEQKVTSDAMRYGNWAMEMLINDILKHGGKRRNLEVKIFGGAHLMKGASDVSQQNIDFALSYLHDENLNVLAKDLGGSVSRQIMYNPMTGKVKMRALADQDAQVASEETQYLRQITTSKPIDGDVELF